MKLVSADAMLKDVVEPSISSYAFSMCNPPFFKSKEERLGGSSDSQRPTPSTVNSGSESETITQGGEVQFVKRMIEDSLVLQNRVRLVEGRENRGEGKGRCGKGRLGSAVFVKRMVKVTDGVK